MSSFWECETESITEEVGEAVKLTSSIREVFGLNLHRATGCFDWGPSWFPSVSPSNYWDRTSIKPWPIPSKSSIILPFDAREHSCWQRRKSPPPQKKQNPVASSGVSRVHHNSAPIAYRSVLTTNQVPFQMTTMVSQIVNANSAPHDQVIEQ
jgi:hypothetical protein